MDTDVLIPDQQDRKFKFTQTSIRAAVSDFDGADDITLRDTELTGFALRKQRTSWNFYIVKKVRGKVHRISIQEWTPETNVAKVRSDAAAIITSMTAGTFVPTAQTKDRLKTGDDAMRMTVADAIDLHRSLNPRTRETTLATYKAQLRAAFGLNLRISMIDRHAVSAWYNGKLSEGRSPAGLNATLAALKAVWVSWASQLSGADLENPAAGFAGKRAKHLKPAQPKSSALPQNKTAAFIRAAMAEMHERGSDGTAAAAVAFTALTGLRISNVTGLRVDNVKERAIMISGDDTKGHAEIIRPITPLMREVLTHQIDCSTGDMLFDVVDTRKAILRACEAAQTPAVTNHDLRRTFITTATLARVPDLAIKLLVGHKPGNITEQYALDVRRALPGFADDIEAKLLEIPNEEVAGEWWQ